MGTGCPQRVKALVFSLIVNWRGGGSSPEPLPQVHKAQSWLWHHSLTISSLGAYEPHGPGRKLVWEGYPGGRLRSNQRNSGWEASPGHVSPWLSPGTTSWPQVLSAGKTPASVVATETIQMSHPNAPLGCQLQEALGTALLPGIDGDPLWWVWSSWQPTRD